MRGRSSVSRVGLELSNLSDRLILTPLPCGAGLQLCAIIPGSQGARDGTQGRPSAHGAEESKN